MADEREELTLGISADISSARNNLRQLRGALENATDPSVMTRLNNSINNTFRNMSRQQQILERLTRSARNAGGAGTTAGSQISGAMATIDFGGAMGSLQGFTDGLSSLIDKFNILDDIANIAIETIKEGFKDFISRGHEFNKSMEQNQMAFETLLGNKKDADSLLGTLKSMASTTPFEFPDLAKNAKTMKSMGFSLKGIPYSLKNIGDAAASTGLGAEGLDRITRALTQMKAKGKISAEEMTGQLGEIIPAWSILSEKMNKSVAEVMDMAQKGTLDVNKSLEMLIEGFGEKYGGLTDKFSQSWDGLMSTIRDVTAQASAYIQKGFFDKIKVGLSGIVDNLTYFNNMLTKTDDIIGSIRSTIQKAFGKDALLAIMPMIESVVIAFDSLKIATMAIFKAIAPVVIGFFQIISPMILFCSNLINQLSTAFAGMSPGMQLAVLGGIALTGIFISLIPVLLSLATAVVGLVIAIGAFGFELLIAGAVVAGILIQLGAFVAGIIGFGLAFYSAWNHVKGFKENMQKSFSGILDSVMVICDNLITIFHSTWKVLLSILEPLWKGFVKVWSIIFSATVEWVNKTLNTFAGLTDILAGTFTGDWSRIWLGVARIFGDYWDNIVDMGQKSINALIGLVNKGINALNKFDVPDWAKDKFGIEGFNIKKLKNVDLSGYKNAVKEANKNIKGSSISTIFSDTLSSTKGVLKDLLDFKLPKLEFEKADYSKPTDGLFDDVSKGLDKVKKGTKKTSDEIQKQLDKVTNRVGKFVESVQNQAQSILTFGGLFEKTVEKKFSGEKLIKAIDSQLSYLEKWKQSLNDLGKRIGTSSSLYKQLLSMGPEAGGQIGALSTLSDEKLAEYQSLFGEKEALSYQMGYEMEAGKMARDIYNQQMVINITGNQISEELDIDIIANKLISKLKLSGVY